MLARLTTVLILLFAHPALADLQRVGDRGTFLAAVEGRELTRVGIRLTISANGAIQGRALGRAVSGTWSWDNGFFCRTLDAGDRQFGLNCQVVSIDGNRIRFQADRGAGDVADFRLE